MPEFRRAPDWDQRADRGTRLSDPVVTVRQLSRFGFARRPLTRIDHALVFSARDGSYETYLPPVRPTRAGAAAKRYTSVYEVDMGVHPVREEIGLPSNDDAFEFGVVVELSWQVVDPALFVASRHRDVPRLLIGELEQSARAVTRRYPASRSAEAEEALLREVRAQGSLGTRAGLAVAWTVRLRGDQEAIDHVRRMRSIDHAATEQVHTERRGREHDAAIDRRVREQDALQWGRAAEFDEQQHELRLRQQKWQHTEAVDRARRQMELQQVNAEKIAFYEKHLEQGGVRAWALHLADHPEDTKLVVTSLRQDQLHMIQAQMELAGELLQGDSAENHELEAPKKRALQALIDVLNQHLPGVTAQSTAEGRLTVSMPQDALRAAPEAVMRSMSRPDFDLTDGIEANSREVHRLDGTPLRKADPETGDPSSPFPGWQPPPGYGSAPLRPTGTATPSAGAEDVRRAPGGTGVPKARTVTAAASPDPRPASASAEDMTADAAGAAGRSGATDAAEPADAPGAANPPRTSDTPRATDVAGAPGQEDHST
ncbi:hypothetical protein OG978_24205 [Streptomyces sp. NBC_01591]|uniref:hypothetical protein n=1 Tax=Streptomyces sp. NBC_01591 TaxID=2975888 RepID=UPI002DDB5F7F|nr:hypothetical protein [Streptomyces sp. NBC_01591]WSD70198.1 hypothetical protein OG978_24205 [Streptomyces sp. NBC_01591]